MRATVKAVNSGPMEKFTDPAQFAIIKAEPNIAKEKNRA